ncbi:hypothetical protein CNR22_11765 [Sphingobacteriaceae bacterium]|nr:hypothetical protein CNR22_11765 [Sphingobacteriaceae bacterium]
MNARNFICLVITLFFISNLKSQEEKYPETVLIKLVETTYGGAAAQAESKIIIVKPDNGIETKALEKASYLKDADITLSDNLVKIRTELQLWQNQGFHIQSMSSASPMTYLIITTIVLTKN